MKDHDDEDTRIRVSLETLARHILETPRKELAALRTAFDRQIASIEARLDASAHQPAIDATTKIIADTIDEHIDRAQHVADTGVTQALAANAMLRKALDNAQQQLESARADLSTAEADRKALAVQHREALNEKKKLATALKNSEQETEELGVERLELQRRLKDATTARATAETQYQQLALASRQLTDGLSQTLQGKREPVRPLAAVPPKRSESADNKPAARVTASAKSTPSATPVAASPVSARKRTLQFSGPARDARRVKIRRGIPVSVDGNPGELVDLSVGGAQLLLRQMVKPNQLVRLIFLTAAGQLICKGRIVWAIYEQPGTSLSVYRTGVKFADADTRAVEDFMTDFCEESLTPSRQSSEIA